MAAGKMRSTRRLRAWMEEQVNSEKYPGLVWDNEAKTMFRIPWKHAGKQDFRQDEDAAIFKAWAEFKGKVTDGPLNNPAHWKTRLRCALNKSTDFQEMPCRAQLDISEPYKVYRLVPFSEQGLETPQKKSGSRATRRSKRSRTSDSEDEDRSSVKHIKVEDVPPQQYVDVPPHANDPQHADEPIQVNDVVLQTLEGSNEIQLDLSIKENVGGAAADTNDQDSYGVSVLYLGRQVLNCRIHNPDVRISYLRSSLVPTPTVLNKRFHRVPLPEPEAEHFLGAEQQELTKLLPFMEKGVLLTSREAGLYGKRCCQGRVFWTGPHWTGLNKLEQNSEPVLLFSKQLFKQQLEHFCANGGEPPRCGITLCFGEELSDAEDQSRKLIIVQVTLLWAEQQVKNTQSLYNSISLLQSLASQSPLGEIMLDLVAIPPPTSDPGV